MIKAAGGAPTVALIIAFSTASHNSVWSFLVGLPFERAIMYHKVFAVLSIVLGGFHGYIAYYGAYGKLQAIPGTRAGHAIA
jgi:NADPH oxidase